jgi:hypothetical protein
LMTTTAAVARTHIEIIDLPNKLQQEVKTNTITGTHHGNEFGATFTPCTPDDSAELLSLDVLESDSDGNVSPTSLIYFGKFAASLHSFRHAGKIAHGVAAPTSAGSLKRNGVAPGGASHLLPVPHAGRGLPLDPNFSQLFHGAADVLLLRSAPSLVVLLRPDLPSFYPPCSRKLIELTVPDTIDGRALNERDAATRCNVCVPSPSSRICSSHLRFLMPPRALVVKLSALELKISLKDGHFPPLLLASFSSSPLSLPSVQSPSLACSGTSPRSHSPSLRSLWRII